MAASNGKQLKRITPEMLVVIANEMAIIASELKFAAESLRKSGKPFIEEYGYREIEKHLQRGRNLAKNIIGASNVGGDVAQILSKVAEHLPDYKTVDVPVAASQKAKRKTKPKDETNELQP